MLFLDREFGHVSKGDTRYRLQYGLGVVNETQLASLSLLSVRYLCSLAVADATLLEVMAAFQHVTHQTILQLLLLHPIDNSFSDVTSGE
jgi:capsule polysaccharide modification protein KpsS